MQWLAYEDMGVVCHCMRPPAFWLVACLHPPPRAQGVTGPPYKGPGSIPPKRCPMITHLFTGLVPRIMRTITSQRGLWWELGLGIHFFFLQANVYVLFFQSPGKCRDATRHFSLFFSGKCCDMTQHLPFFSPQRCAPVHSTAVLYIHTGLDRKGAPRSSSSL